MKKILVFILVFISNNAFSKISLVDEMLNNLDNKIQANYIIINQLSEIILKKRYWYLSAGMGKRS